ncbi:tyrosine-type recombinase/integrase [Deinococcus roseus]|uniref:Site-specific integrase n=1 Tax=Deinococcus roseus TaxID=392414 RepID=A0ABQ2DJS2_9DEIO|nr:site-specific integrase [Deinococcus roseus]GGJ59571.1 site-specific integrase [Deinococcus roseus]
MSKRGNGTGSIQQRGSKYVVILTLGKDEMGKQKRTSRRFPTLEQAQRYLEEQTTPPASGGATTGNEAILAINLQTSVLDYLQEWLRLRQSHIRIKTHQEYHRIIDLHLKSSLLADVTLGSLTPLHLERLLLGEITAGKTVKHARCVLRTLKAALNQAVDWNLLSFNPVLRVKAPRVSHQKMQVWTADEVRTFLDCCKVEKPRLYALFYLALTTGLRRGELLGLHWQEVDLDRQEVQVKFSLVQCGARAVLGDPKTHASYRRISLSADTVQVLKSHLVMQEQEEKHWKDLLLEEESLLFPSIRGGFQLPSNLIKVFHKLIGLAGVPRIRLHDLRHTAASLLVRQGVPIKVVAERLGHQDASMTLRVYTHVYEEQRKEAALTLNDLLKDPAKQIR